MNRDTQATQAVRSQDAGFTLVELLVALALLSLLTLALFGTMGFGIKAWNRSTVHTDQADHEVLVQNFLRRVITDVYPLFLADDPTHGHVDFNGTDKSLDFLSTVPIALGEGGRSRFHLSIAQHDNRIDLVMTSDRELAHRGNSPTQLAKTLIANAESIEFSYFGQTRADKNSTWHANWAGESNLPQLIRVRVHFPDGDTRFWPDLLIAPRITADVGCVYDALTKLCRGR